MTGPRSKCARRVIVVGALAGALAACGVKGPLEPPPSAKLTAAESESAEDAVAAKTFSEQSSIRRVGTPSVLPKFPPAEWARDRLREPRAVDRRDKPEQPDEPFFLDPLL